MRAVPALLLLAVLPATAADRWTRLTTPHFEMYTTADEKKARDVIQYLERVREFFLRASPVKPPGEFPTRIVAFRDSNEFYAHAPNKMVAAFFVPGPLRDCIVMQDPASDIFPKAIHEYTHLVIRHSGLQIPLWMNEGWAEVYSTLKPVKDGVAVGDLLAHHIKTLGQGQWFSLEQLQMTTQQSPDYNESARTGMFYSESWALTHMLYLAPDYKDNFGKFITALHHGRPIGEAMQTAYGKSSAQVFADLRSYFARKKLFGTVFLTPFARAAEEPRVDSVAPYDADLTIADIDALSGHAQEAATAYQRLEAESPARVEAFQSAGYLAVRMGDAATARKEFTKAYALGTDDPQLCMQLATLEREANEPPALVIAHLERAVKLRPDFSEALFQLGLMKMAVREFDAAIDLLNRVGPVAPDRMSTFRAGLAYSYLETGNIGMALPNAQAARKAAKAPVQAQLADHILQLIEARSQGPAAAKAGEKLFKAEGTAVGLRCETQESGLMSKMAITVGGRQLLFDLPGADAVEVDKQPGSTTELKCGPLPPFPVMVEFVPGSGAQNTVGLIRRIVF